MVVKALRVEDAVGYRLFHDYTCIEHGFKGAVKRRGEIVTSSDVDLLKRCGHFYVYVYDEGPPNPEFIHEEEAVNALARSVAGSNVTVELAQEAKALLLAAKSGLLLVKSEALREINSKGVFIVVTRKSGYYARRGDIVGVVDLIPLYIHRELLDEHVEILAKYKPVITINENKQPKIGVVVTGNEIVEGLRKDLASPIVIEKIKRYECIPGDVEYARDSTDEISNKILSILRSHDAVIVTGGMSVDPTDQTFSAITSVADEVVIYGVPIKPTTMSTIAYSGDKAIIGVSSGIIYYPEENILDIVLPWVASGVKIPREFLISLGEGGLLGSFLMKYSKVSH
jgi:hypothetical protein